MLKFSYVVNLALAGALVVPPVLLQSGRATGLERALSDTVAALDVLSGVSERIEAGDYAAVEELLESTEPPAVDEQETDARVDGLRVEISELQSKLDRMRSGAALDPSELLSGSRPPLVGSSPRSGGPTTTGLSERERQELAGIWVPVTGGREPAPAGDPRRAFEAEGYSVDPVRHGRAYYRAGRYTEALRLLASSEGVPEADYWIGRTLERMDRVEDAIAAYTRVVDALQTGPLAERARTDRDFLKWRVDFRSEVEGTVAGEGAAPQ